MSTLHVGLCGPVAGQDIAALMGVEPQQLPKGYEGAPLMVTLIEGLLSQGHRVSVFTLSNDLSVADGGRRFSSLSHPGLTLTFCPLRPHAWRPCEGRPGRILDLYRHERLALVESLRREAPDVVHAHWVYEFAWAALDSGLPTVVTSHDAPLAVARMNAWAKPTVSLYRWLRLLMARLVLRRALHVTAVSPHLQQTLRGMALQRVSVIPNPVDATLIVRGRDRQLGVAPRLVLISNGWDRIKNAQPALLAFARLQARMPGLELHLYGHGFQPEGRAHAWCRRQGAMAAALPAIRFHGPVPHGVLMQALEGMDLLLHPSLEESFGMVLVEAMALGVPVLGGMRSGAVPWVVQEARCLCDVRDAESIAEAAGVLLRPDVHAQLSHELRMAVARRFALDRVLQGYAAVYREALANAGRCPGP